MRFIYQQLYKAASPLQIMLQIYFDSVEWYEEVTQLPVQGIGLDFVCGLEENLLNLQKVSFSDDKVLGVCLIDGRNIWRSDLWKKRELIQSISAYVDHDRIWLQPSCSLLHVQR